jgi:hypothetical protein
MFLDSSFEGSLITELEVDLLNIKFKLFVQPSESLNLPHKSVVLSLVIKNTLSKMDYLSFL